MTSAKNLNLFQGTIITEFDIHWTEQKKPIECSMYTVHIKAIFWSVPNISGVWGDSQYQFWIGSWLLWHIISRAGYCDSYSSMFARATSTMLRVHFQKIHFEKYSLKIQSRLLWQFSCYCDSYSPLFARATMLQVHFQKVHFRKHTFWNTLSCYCGSFSPLFAFAPTSTLQWNNVCCCTGQTQCVMWWTLHISRCKITHCTLHWCTVHSALCSLHCRHLDSSYCPQIEIYGYLRSP